MPQVYKGSVTLSNPGGEKPFKAQRNDGSFAGVFAQLGEAKAEIERPFGRRLTWEVDVSLAEAGVEGYKAFE